MASIDVDLPEDVIRLRSYLIWQHEGCPHGSALDHWLRAKTELEAELQAKALLAGPPLRKALAFVMPRVPISSPPCRSVATKIAPERRAATANAAKR